MARMSHGRPVYWGRGRHTNQTPGRWQVRKRSFVSWSRDEFCVLHRPPFSHYVLGRTPASGRRAPQNGGLISSAFLASVVCVHGEDCPGQQKANPNVGLGNVSSPHFGGCGVQPVSKQGPTEHAVREGGALHNTHALLCNARGNVAQQKPSPARPLQNASTLTSPTREARAHAPRVPFAPALHRLWRAARELPDRTG